MCLFNLMLFSQLLKFSCVMCILEIDLYRDLIDKTLFRRCRWDNVRDPAKRSCFDGRSKFTSESFFQLDSQLHRYFVSSDQCILSLQSAIIDIDTLKHKYITLQVHIYFKLDGQMTSSPEEQNTHVRKASAVNSPRLKDYFTAVFIGRLCGN